VAGRTMMAMTHEVRQVVGPVEVPTLPALVGLL